MILTAGVSGAMFLVSAILVSVSILYGVTANSDREKNSPFECGFDPVGSVPVSLSLRFFLIAVIFLVFDVEIALLLPSFEGLLESKLVTWVFLGEGIFINLISGSYHEWREGALDWKS
uniref:NADH-ubiquinone oxidoreductase chain 3 n=1 Tax=Idotea baltica TaxID=82763 RepID=Q19TW6_9CRUS|nr:NADH dehydrogenase subunit 3 [Idotea baltica]